MCLRNIRQVVVYTYTFDVHWRNPLFGRAGLGEGPYDNDPLYVPTSQKRSARRIRIISRCCWIF